jgi:hypothetical protein
MRIAIATLAVAGLVILPATSAHANHEDTHPCVSPREQRSAQGFFDNTRVYTREALQQHWEVTGRGRVTITGIGTVVRYKRCGHSMDESYSFAGYSRGEVWTVGIYTTGTGRVTAGP